MIYVNEFDPFAAAWLRELSAAGHIPSAVVDERSIKDVEGAGLDGYREWHLFGGIGGWPLALRLAGWDVDADGPVLTGSCPCQPFSAAGKRKGTADERHLWPEMLRVVRELRPPVVLGEQVASKDGRAWLAGVRADLEALGYAVGAADLCAAGQGAPHIRQRLFWVADAGHDGGAARLARGQHESGAPVGQRAGSGGEAGGLADAQREQGGDQPGWRGGYWDRFAIVHCQDGKARRFESGSFPLVARLPEGLVPGGDPGAPVRAGATAEARAGRLRGYGNSIVPQVAAVFIRSFMEATGRRPCPAL